MHFHVKSIEIKKQYKSLFKLRVAHMCYSQIKERLITQFIFINYSCIFINKLLLYKIQYKPLFKLIVAHVLLSD